MFLTVEIRGAAKLIRHRNGEELSDPVLEFEDGSDGAQPQPIARMDLTRGNPEGFYATNMDRTAPTELANPLYAAIASAGGASAGEGWDESERDGQPSERRPHERLGTPDQGELLRLLLERPRRFLRRLYAESRRRGPLTVRFTRSLDVGRAVLDISAHGRDCVARALLEVAPARSGSGSGGVQAKSHRAAGFVAVALEIDADLRPDGSLDRVASSWKTRGLTLTGKEARVLHRFTRVVSRIADDPAPLEHRRRRLGRVLSSWLRDHPEWGVALIAQLVERLEALPLIPSVRQRRKDRGPPSMEEILAGIGEPGTDELMLGAPPPPGIAWTDDRTPRLLLPEAGQSAAAMAELSRLACVIPMILDRLS